MNDRELLELAAEAAGIFGEWVENSTEGEYYKLPTSGIKTISEGRTHVWNPLTSSGDALRLAIRLEMDVSFGLRGAVIEQSHGKKIQDLDDNEPYAANRRAIVRAAAPEAKP